MDLRYKSFLLAVISATLMLGACGSAGGSSGSGAEQAGLKWCSKYLQRSELNLSKSEGDESCSCMQDGFKYAGIAFKDLQGARQFEAASIAMECMEEAGGLDNVAGFDDGYGATEDDYSSSSNESGTDGYDDW